MHIEKIDFITSEEDGSLVWMKGGTYENSYVEFDVTATNVCVNGEKVDDMQNIKIKFESPRVCVYQKSKEKSKNQPSYFDPVSTCNIHPNTQLKMIDPFKSEPFEFMKKPTFENAIAAYEFSLKAMMENNSHINMFIAAYFYLYMMDERAYLPDAPKVVHDFYAKNIEFVTNDNYAIEDNRKKEFFNYLQTAIIKNSREVLYYDVEIVTDLVNFINRCNYEYKNEMVFHFIHNVYNRFVSIYLGMNSISNKHSYTDCFIKRFIDLKKLIMNSPNSHFGIYKEYCVHEIDVIVATLKPMEYKPNVSKASD